jgi:hypothetical protein
MLDVKQVVRIAFEFVNELLKEETIRGLRLEEVERLVDGRRWNITVSFIRPGTGPIAAITALQQGPRDFKTLSIDGESGEVESMKTARFAATSI